jgi:hypothetical protein
MPSTVEGNLRLWQCLLQSCWALAPSNVCRNFDFLLFCISESLHVALHVEKFKDVHGALLCEGAYYVEQTCLGVISWRAVRRTSCVRQERSALEMPEVETSRNSYPRGRSPRDIHPARFLPRIVSMYASKQPKISVLKDAFKSNFVDDGWIQWNTNFLVKHKG